MTLPHRTPWRCGGNTSREVPPAIMHMPGATSHVRRPAFPCGPSAPATAHRGPWSSLLDHSPHCTTAPQVCDVGCSKRAYLDSPAPYSPLWRVPFRQKPVKKGAHLVRTTSLALPDRHQHSVLDRSEIPTLLDHTAPRTPSERAIDPQSLRPAEDGSRQNAVSDSTPPPGGPQPLMTGDLSPAAELASMPMTARPGASLVQRLLGAATQRSVTATPVARHTPGRRWSTCR
jgi:hypothetical protein